MRTENLKVSLPHKFALHPGVRKHGIRIVGEWDIGLRGSRLRAKVILFDRHSDFLTFWDKVLGRGGLPRTTEAVCSRLHDHVRRYDRKGKLEDEFIRQDPRYYCAIGFSLTALTIRIVAHEAFHAACAYVERVGKRSGWAKMAKRIGIEEEMFDEEMLAYPLGDMTSAIIGRLNPFWHRRRNK